MKNEETKEERERGTSFEKRKRKAAVQFSRKFDGVVLYSLAGNWRGEAITRTLWGFGGPLRLLPYIFQRASFFYHTLQTIRTYKIQWIQKIILLQRKFWLARNCPCLYHLEKCWRFYCCRIYMYVFIFIIVCKEGLVWLEGPPYHAWCNINNHLIREDPKTDVVHFILNPPNKVWQRHFCASKKTA